VALLIDISFRSGVLCDTVAEGPGLLLDLDEINENALMPQADSLMQTVGDGLVEGLDERLRTTSQPTLRGFAILYCGAVG
jgi:hypothetical protein